MKSKFYIKRIILFVGLFLYPIISYCQVTNDSTERVNGNIKFYPLQLLVGEVRVSYEKPVSQNVSLEFSPGYLFGIILGETDGDLGPEGKEELDTKYKGYALREGIRFYLSERKNHSGLYFEQMFLYKYAFSQSYSGYYPYLYTSENVNMYSFQLLVGKKFLIHKEISFEIYGGIGFKKVYDTYDFHDPVSPVVTDRVNYFTLPLGFSIGYIIY
jgi:hypothetical protein